MAMARGPPLHRRPRGAGAAETTSWAVGGAPHMSSTPIWLVGHRGQAAIAATGVSDGGERGGAQQPFLSIELSNGFSRAQSLPRRPGCIECLMPYRTAGNTRIDYQTPKSLEIVPNLQKVWSLCQTGILVWEKVSPPL